LLGSYALAQGSGPAAGTTTDIDVFKPGNTPAGEFLQLAGAPATSPWTVITANLDVDEGGQAHDEWTLSGRAGRRLAGRERRSVP
jgi:hypothetical protein